MEEEQQKKTVEKYSFPLYAPFFSTRYSVLVSIINNNNSEWPPNFQPKSRDRLTRIFYYYFFFHSMRNMLFATYMSTYVWLCRCCAEGKMRRVERRKKNDCNDGIAVVMAAAAAAMLYYLEKLGFPI